MNRFGNIRKRGRLIATFFALNIIFEIVAPLKLMALTGGPSQPESSSFEPVGTTEMVDLFSGDFTYNIPLFDIGGYPVNISYHAGIGMDQEATWVGLGWNINPGAINRGMRGIPDDFTGDEIVKYTNTKPNKTIGFNYSGDLEIFGFAGMKKRNQSFNKYKQVKRMNQLDKTNFGFGIVYNNYKGMGYSLDVSTEMQKTHYLTEVEFKEKITQASTYASQEFIDKTGDLNVDNQFNTNKEDWLLKDKEIGDRIAKTVYGKKILNTSTKDLIIKDHKKSIGKISISASSGGGSSVNYNFSSNNKSNWVNKFNVNQSIGIGYNSFVGMTSFEFGFSTSKDTRHDKIKSIRSSNGGIGSYLPIGNYSYIPYMSTSNLSTSQSFNFTLGFDAFGGHPNMRMSGFYNTEEIEEKNKIQHVKSYGYLYEQDIYEKRGDGNILMDFNREKESVGNKNATHLPIANHTYDIYSISGQGIGGMYRPHRKTIGILHDKTTKSENKKFGMNDIGLELGFGQWFRFGINYKNKVQRASSGLWYDGKNEGDFLKSDEDNQLVGFLNYRMDTVSNNKRNKQFYFKAAGEQTPSDNDIANSWSGAEAVALKISKNGKKKNLRFAKIEKSLIGKSQNIKAFSNRNPIRNNVITFLTAEEASVQGIGYEPQLISYPQNYWSNFIKSQIVPEVESFNRYNGENGAKRYHISEVTTYGNDGMRYVYGIPAYNKVQKETNFAISKDMVGGDISERAEYVSQGLVHYEPSLGDNSVSNTRGIDNYYSQTNLPPYAHSYLLTSVLSPDYADLTGNGITDDDYGSAVKFNYHKINGSYQWRTPYEENTGNLDLGLITDNADNKASYIYGEKELWYLQSMESKTHIAEFKLSKRNDGHGVKGENGGLDTSINNCQMKLDSIVIFSKIDLLINGKNAIPVKTIVFQYDYSLCQGISNSENSQGKLTLKSIYFTYGNSGKGVLNPYRFTYSNFNPNYSHVHFDKWGNYKYANEKLPNRDFPYTDMDSSREVYDKYSSAWNLTKVRLPSGGEINVEYEADDYAFVQNRRAMQMVKVVAASHRAEDIKRRTLGIDNPKKATIMTSQLYDNGKEHTYLYFDLLEPDSEIPDNDEARGNFIKDKYLKNENGEIMTLMYYRFKVNMDPRSKNSNHFEYVSGYAEIDIDKCGITSDKKYGFVKLKEVSQGDVGLTKCNPICKQAWQFGMQYLRKVMYPGSDQSQDSEDGNKQNAFKALINSYAQMLNIFTGPYQNLKWKHIAKNFEVDKSFMRLYRPDGHKVGGGSRVKKITISDDWNDMNTDQASGQYGQEFYYLTKNNRGEIVSSGVASYEPFVGGDENPMRVPAFYSTNKFMFPNANDYLEEPFGETFFPSASVGYSRVVVKNIPKEGTKATNTGKVVHEFYTYKDFPLITTNTNLKYFRNGSNELDRSKNDKKGRKGEKRFSKALSSLFSIVKKDYMAATQGYSIVLNDMHGKPKSTAVYSSLDEEGSFIERLFNGRLISGTEYKYKTNASNNPNNFNSVFSLQDTTRFKPSPSGASLNNIVWVMKENGNMEQKEIATTYDIDVDTRQSKSHFRHAGVDFNLENFLIFGIPCPYPKYLVNQDLFQSAVVTKVIQQYGVLEEVIAYDHSSIVKTKNLVWDEQTGQVLLSATTNEFEDPIFNFTYPAHLAYDRMGPAYKNIDHESSLTISGNGDVNVGLLTYEDKKMFIEGDELLLKNGSVALKAWVLKATINSSTGNYKQIRLIDIAGQAIASGSWNCRVIRSGRKNLSSTPVGVITTMYKKIFNKDSSNRLVLNKDVVQSSAVTYSDNWQGYLNKAAKLKEVCDTTYLGKYEAYQLIKSMVSTGNQKMYYYNGTSIPPDAMTLSAYSGALKSSVLSYANSRNVSECGDEGKSVSSIYFGRDIGAPSVFYFKSKYKCQPSGNEYLKNLTCEMYIEKEDTSCILKFDSLDRIDNYYPVSSTIANFTGYKGTDSCIYNLVFTNNCFTSINCKYIFDCDYTAGANINPFVNNIKGVWRQKEAFAFNSSRVYESKTYNNTNIRKDGFIKDYKPFWKFEDDSTSGLKETNEKNWVSTGVATVYMPEGNGVEEKDALGIYSSQIFGYNNLLVKAQASNARYTQIAFDNFEDYFFPYVGCEKESHFDFKEGMSLGSIERKTYNNSNVLLKNLLPIRSQANVNVRLAKDTAHTGFYSLCLTAGQSHSNVKRINYSSVSFENDNDSLFRVKDFENIIVPFSPKAGKYVVSTWVFQATSDQNQLNNYVDAYVNVKIFSGGSAVVNKDFKASGAIIENWQRVDGVFEIPDGADSIKISLVNLSANKAYFDDVRVQPFDSKMIGHVYDFVKLRVIAELDENNYATFYEYDDEGSLIRVKRETEKGIMTIQESRKSIRKIED